LQQTGTIANLGGCCLNTAAAALLKSNHWAPAPERPALSTGAHAAGLGISTGSLRPRTWLHRT
jgi:hypothetical protein